MKEWQRRIGRAALMGLAWAVVWAAVAIVIGTTIVDPDNSHDEMWWLMGAFPGLVCGGIFSAVLGITDGRRRLDELSLSRAGAWGAVSGLLVVVPWFVLALVSDGFSVWRVAVVLISSMTLMSAVSAAVSALLARMAKKREWHDASAHAA